MGSNAIYAWVCRQQLAKGSNLWSRAANRKHKAFHNLARGCQRLKLAACTDFLMAAGSADQLPHEEAAQSANLCFQGNKWLTLYTTYLFTACANKTCKLKSPALPLPLDL